MKCNRNNLTTYNSHLSHLKAEAGDEVLYVPDHAIDYATGQPDREHEDVRKAVVVKASKKFALVNVAGLKNSPVTIGWVNLYWR